MTLLSDDGLGGGDGRGFGRIMAVARCIRARHNKRTININIL